MSRSSDEHGFRFRTEHALCLTVSLLQKTRQFVTDKEMQMIVAYYELAMRKFLSEHIPSDKAYERVMMPIDGMTPIDFIEKTLGKKFGKPENGVENAETNGEKDS